MNATALEKIKAAFPDATCTTALDSVVVEVLPEKLEGTLSRLKNDPAFNCGLLLDVTGIDYLEYLLNNRELQVPSFPSSAHKCEGVFETLNMITRMLLHKFVSQGTPQYA